jgi:hypothetical protein
MIAEIPLQKTATDKAKPIYEWCLSAYPSSAKDVVLEALGDNRSLPSQERYRITVFSARI